MPPDSGLIVTSMNSLCRFHCSAIDRGPPNSFPRIIFPNERCWPAAALPPRTNTNPQAGISTVAVVPPSSSEAAKMCLAVAGGGPAMVTVSRHPTACGLTSKEASTAAVDSSPRRPPRSCSPRYLVRPVCRSRAASCRRGRFVAPGSLDRERLEASDEIGSAHSLLISVSSNCAASGEVARAVP